MEPEREELPGADRLAKAVEAFIARRRGGDDPSIEDFAREFGDRADEAREVFSALKLIEDVGRDAGATGTRSLHDGGPAPPRLGEYEIVREIGRGGMGVVYEARQASLGRRVALKVLPSRAVADPGLLERFRRESQAAAGLQHPNIVPVFGAGEDGGVPYYAMQYIEGRSLADLLSEVRRRRSPPRAGQGAAEDGTSSPAALRLLGGPIPPGDPSSCGSGGPKSGALPVAADGPSSSDPHPAYFRNVAAVGLQAAEALAHAHSRGVLHRDIKPSNLLLDDRGKLWVTDFGLAKEEGAGDLTASGDFVGTLSFMAPERFRGWSDPRSDIYGLGISLYSLAALQPAFEDADRARLVRKVLAEEPPRPRKVERRIPLDLETVILKAIEKDPDHRYQNAEALAADLRAFIEGRPVGATRASPLDRACRWCGRNRATSSLAGAAVLLLLVAVGAVLIARWSARAEMEARYWRLLSEARADSAGGRGGRVAASLRSLREAIHLLPDLGLDAGERDRRVLEIRDRIVVTTTLADVGLAREWRPPPPAGAIVEGSFVLALDDRLGLCALIDPGKGLRVLRIEDGALVLDLPGARGDGMAGLFDRAGKRLAVFYAGGGSPAIRVWDLENGGKVLDVPGAPDRMGMAFHPLEAVLAVGSAEGAVLSYRLGREEPGDRISLPGGAIPARLSFRPDGRVIAVSCATGSGSEIILLDAATGEVRCRLPHPQAIHGFAWHPAGSRLAVACDDAMIYLWDPEGGKLLSVLRGHEAEVREVAFGHRGEVLGSRAWDTTFRLWDVQDPRLLATAYSRAARTGPRFSAGDYFGGVGVQGPAVMVWEARAGRGCRSFRCEGSRRKGPFDVDLSPGGRFLAATGYDGLRLWDVPSGFEVARLDLPQSEYSSVRFHPDGRRLIAALDQGIFECPLAVEEDPRGDRLRLGPPRRIEGDGPSGGRSSLSGDGRLLAVVRGDRGAIIDLASGSESLLAAPHPRLDKIAISLDGRWAGTSTWDGKRAKVWDAASGAPVADLPPDGRAAVVWSPGGERIVVSEPGKYAIYSTAGWIPEGEIDRDNPGDILGPAAFDPGGRILAVARTPWSIRLLDPSSRRPLADLEAPERHMLTALRFGPDGSILAAATAGNVIQVWDLREIRARLAELEVDWPLPPYPPGPAPAPPRAIRAEVDLGDLGPAIPK
jgi:eukaryotic-like serine/threonine-protein kinase